MTIKYVASFRYDEAQLAQIEIGKETPKTLVIKGKWLNLIGGFSYLPDRLGKDNYNIFGTEKDAINWLLEEAKERQGDLEEMLDKVKEQVKELKGHLDDNQA